MFEKKKKHLEVRTSAAQLSSSSDVSILEDSGNCLMLKVKAGDRKAFEMLYEHYRPKVEGYLFQLTKSREHAEELVQELFLKVYRHRETYEPEAKFAAWIWQMARNAVIDKVRKKTETPFSVLGADEEGEFQFSERTTDFETALLERSTLEQVEKFMLELPEAQREALSLFALSGTSYEEIAKLMKVSVSSVKSLIFRARSTLLKRMQNDG